MYSQSLKVPKSQSFKVLFIRPGMPLPRLKPLADARLSDDLNGPPKPHHVVRSGSITFSRNRMLYATAAFDGVGHVRHGLPLIRKCTLQAEADWSC